MKRLFPLLFAGLALVLSCNSADNEGGNTTNGEQAASGSEAAATQASQSTQPESDNLTTIQWADSSDQDLGQIKEGQILEISFNFKNTGSKPLVISKAWASCGCTVPETPKEPFAPGQSGVIKASFNSTGKAGLNHKEVYVNANTSPETSTLSFTVNVEKTPGSK